MGLKHGSEGGGEGYLRPYTHPPTQCCFGGDLGKNINFNILRTKYNYLHITMALKPINNRGITS